MSAARLPKVAGTKPPVPSAAHNAAHTVECRPVDRLAAVQDQLAAWISDLTTLHEFTERLTRTNTLDEALHEVLRAGAALVGARRGLVVLEPADRQGPDTTVGLGLECADLGALETVPRTAAPYSGLTGGRPDSGAADGVQNEVIHADLLHEPGIDPRHREVAVHLGFGASYGLRLACDAIGHLGTAVWLYDEPAEPGQRRRHLAGLYIRYAAEHIARQLELTRARAAVATLAEEMLPTRLPHVPGVRLAVRHRTGPLGGGDWYDALPLPEGALGLAVGAVTGFGPSVVAAMGRVRSSLRAYAVMEGEDPVAVLSDLELLLRLTEPARSATALFAYCDPGRRSLVMAGAGHCPPLVVGDRRVEYVETSLSAPLAMLSCWEAPSVAFRVLPGETVLFFTDGILHRSGEPPDRAMARLHAAAQSAPRALREDPELLVDHVLRTHLPGGPNAVDGPGDVVLLAVRFDR